MAGKGTLIVRVVSDTKDVEAGLGRVDTALGKFGATADSTGEKMSRAGQKMTLFATVPIVAGLGLATDAASNLEQSMGAVESIFGSAAGPVLAFGEQAAETAGLSKREVNEMAAVLGASLQGMGFEAGESAEKVVELQKRGADMAATFGGTTKDALEAVASLMRGERDPIERYGVSIKAVDVSARIAAMGLDTSTAASQKNAEAVAGLDLLMEQTAKTQGQFARESDSAAGAQQRAKAAIENSAATLGEKLLPLAAGAADKVADLAENFSDLPDPIQKGVLALGALVALSGPILTVAGNVGKLTTSLRNVDFAAMAAKGGFAAATVAIVGFGVAAAAAAEGMDAKIVKAFESLTSVADKELVEAFDKAGGRLSWFQSLSEGNLGAATRLRDALDAQGRSTAELDPIIASAAEKLAVAERGAQGAAEAVAEHTGAVDDDTEALEDNSDAVERNRKRYEENVKAIEDARDAQKKVADALGLSARTTDDVISAQREAHASTEAWTKKVADLEDAVEDANEALRESQRLASSDDLEGAALGVERAYVRQGDALDAVKEAEAELNRLRRQAGTTEEIAEAEEKVRDARFASQRATDDVNDAESDLDTLRQSGTATAEELERATRRLREARVDERRAVEDLGEAQTELDRLRKPATPEQLAAAERVLSDAIRDQRDAALALREAQQQQQQVQRQGSDLDERVIDARRRVRQATDELAEAQRQAGETARIEAWYVALLRNEYDRLADSIRRIPDYGSADSQERRGKSMGGGGSVAVSLTVAPNATVVDKRAMEWLVGEAMPEIRRQVTDIVRNGSSFSG